MTATPSAPVAQTAFTTAWTSDWWMTRSSGSAPTGRLPSGRTGASSRVISTPAPLTGTQGRGERPGVPGAPRGGHGAVSARGPLGQPVHLALEIGELLALPAR